MELLHSVILGIVQGLTEFLPISSSGHLVLSQNVLGFSEPEVLFDICLHVGTLVAVCVVFFHQIRLILMELVRMPQQVISGKSVQSLVATNPEIRTAYLILIGSIPTALIGLYFQQIVEQIFGPVWITGSMLLVTGTLLWFTRRCALSGRDIIQFRVTDALIIGIIQGLAILPGISRSGSTISVALFIGIHREIAGRFSFLLSIPAIIGALALGLDSSTMQTSMSMPAILLGTAAAAASGYAALKILLHVVHQGKLYWFSPYCWLLGAIAVGWAIR
jgi:undecaprenyl-diphosphatase